ncbi:MAG: hypothetical protein ABFR82_09740 [Nitrospirota bacterium]
MFDHKFLKYLRQEVPEDCPEIHKELVNWCCRIKGYWLSDIH